MSARRFLRRSLVVALLAVLSLAARADATTGLEEWQPAQVIDARPEVGRRMALLSTALGRAAVVYGVGKQTWVSSRPTGSDASWSSPKRLTGAPEEAFAGPVATGSGGGAVVFLRSYFGEIAYASMSPTGDWAGARAFPYDSTFVPHEALVRPGSGIVAVGTGHLGGLVRAAVKPQGARWQLSSRLDLEGRKLVQGAWFGTDDRVHVLLAVAQHGNLDRREMFTAVLRLGADGPRWGEVRLVPRGTEGGTLGDLHGVSAVTNPDGAVTVQWLQVDEGLIHEYVRHRDPAAGWTPAHRLPDPALGLPVVSTLAADGTTRLSYLTSPAGGGYALVTRLLAADGTLGDEEVLDTYAGDGLFLGAAQGAPGDVSLQWSTGTDEAVEQRLFRCLAVSGCVAVGSYDGRQEALFALTPAGVGFMAGTDGAVPGCPPGALCSRRLPTTGGAP